ncbi:hypothetical protein HMN09_00372500 [Mycena chlorophos]|uniref:Uncharacterized protein n=1 Tax=Mycena chlorophos TaxID=658473 RepID=A0A8H6WHA4_MYCCL|nr:hypothetical protein HMN09_00372500 [Mycena chlorophos]
MASERSSTDSILVSAMKQNAELKAAVAEKDRDVRAAEQALSILVRENEDLEKKVNDAKAGAGETSQRMERIRQKLHDADAEIDRLRGDLRRRKDDIRRLRDEHDVLQRANAHLSRRRSELQPERQSRPVSSVSESVSAPGAPPPYSPAIPQSRTPEPWSKQDIPKRYMRTLPAPTTIAETFDATTALLACSSAHKVLEACQSLSRRHTLYLPGRITWVGVGGGHALGYAPTHEFYNGAWRPHTQLTDLASAGGGAEVELFVGYNLMVHYAGTYRVHSFRGVEGYVPGGDVPDAVSHASVYNAMRLRGGPSSAEAARRIRENAAWARGDSDGRVKVECFGLERVGFDGEVYGALRARFPGGESEIAASGESGIGGEFGKRKGYGMAGQEGKPKWKKRRVG